MTTSSVTLVLGGWLIAGLLLEGLVCARQWRHLAKQRLSRFADDATRAQRMRRYGQRRALFSWLESLERVLRVALWVAAGGLVGLHTMIGGLPGVGAIVFVGVFAVCDQLLGEVRPWARWWFVDHACGVSRTGAPALAVDSMRRLLVNGAIGVVAGAWVLWPFALWAFPVAWTVSAVCMLAGSGVLFWARPNVIDPLFARFSRLEPGELRSRLETMMRRCGTHLEDVLVVDSSKRSNLANAYFTGLGRTKRVVLFDTLIAHLPPDEIEAVMAHELGHYRCGHIRRFYGSQALLMGMGYVVFGGAVHVLGGLAPPVAVVAAYVVLPAIAWPLAPWHAARRRRYEYEADAYAARHARPRALVNALERLLSNNLNAPTMDSWYAHVYATHPPGEQRLQRLAAFL